MNKQVIKDILKVTRSQIGPNGQEYITVTYDRIKQQTTFCVNGKMIWGVCGKWAEKFFNKYGLLIS